MMGKVISYRLTLNAPVVLSMPGGDANSASTLSYISGSSVIGALANLWVRKNSSAPGSSPVFRRLFLNGSVRYLNAYPEDLDYKDKRLIPVPLSFYQEKDQETQVYDLSCKEHDDALEFEAGQPRTLVHWDPGFMRTDGEDAIRFLPREMDTCIHHRRDRAAGRATEGSGEIFSYISLPKGERFIGHILLNDKSDCEVIEGLLKGHALSFGRSKSAQYGGNVKVDILESCDHDHENPFLEAGKATVTEGQRFILTLLSDYLGITPSGHATNDPENFVKELAEKLSVAEENLSVEDYFVASRPVAGYVSAWRMPRPVHPALKAGSIFVISSKQDISQNLPGILWEGLGYRRPEGFGRLAIDAHGWEHDDDQGNTVSVFDCVEIRRKRDGSVSSWTPVTGITQTSEMLTICRQRLLEEALDRQVIEIAGSMFTHGPERVPSRAALGRIRGLLRLAKNGNKVKKFLDDCNGKKAGKDLRLCKIANQSLYEWLYKLFTKPNNIKTQLKVDETANISRLDTKEDTIKCFDSSMAFTFKRRLADLVLKKLSELSKAQEEKRKEAE